MTSTMSPQDQLQSPTTSYAGAFLFFGTSLLILGLLAIASVVFFTISTVMVFGAILIAAGIAECVKAVRAPARDRVVLSIVSAIVYIAAGSFLIFRPLAGALTLTVAIGAFFAAAGIMRISTAIQRRKTKDWVWFLLSGILDLALATIIMTGWPVSGLWLIGLFVGIEMITHGVAWIVLASTIPRINQNTQAPA